jgi:hypothetical protein
VDPLTDPIEGADRREVGGAIVEIVRAGNGRDEEAVLVQFDAEEGTARRFGLPAEHERHPQGA